MAADEVPANTQLVGMTGNGRYIAVQNPPQTLTPDQAIGFAAWLVVIAEPLATTKFEDVRRAVEST